MVQGLHGGEDHVAGLLRRGEEPQPRLRADLTEDVACLGEDLLAMGEEQDPRELGALRVEDG